MFEVVSGMLIIMLILFRDFFNEKRVEVILFEIDVV